jgi:hypothetical protein
MRLFPLSDDFLPDSVLTLSHATQILAVVKYSQRYSLSPSIAKKTPSMEKNMQLGRKNSHRRQLRGSSQRNAGSNLKRHRRALVSGMWSGILFKEFFLSPAARGRQ